MAILCFGQCQSQRSYFWGKNIIYILPRPNFGSPCISVSSKTRLFWFYCQWFWTPYGSQILEIYIIMLVEFVFYGQCSGEPCTVSCWCPDSSSSARHGLLHQCFHLDNILRWDIGMSLCQGKLLFFISSITCSGVNLWPFSKWTLRRAL